MIVDVFLFVLDLLVVLDLDDDFVIVVVDGSGILVV